MVPASGVQYRVVGPINLGNNVRFRGCGQSGTVRTKLRHDASAPGSVLMLADQGGLMSGVAVSNFIISTPNNLQTFSIRLRDCVYSEISDLLIGAANLVEKNVAIHLQTMTAIIPTMGFITIRNISTTSLEANSGWSGDSSIGIWLDGSSGIALGGGGSSIVLEGYGDMEGRGTAIQGKNAYDITVTAWLLAAVGTGAASGPATHSGASLNLSQCGVNEFDHCSFFNSLPTGAGGSPPQGIVLDSACYENVISYPLLQFIGHTPVTTGISDAGVNTLWLGTGGSSAISPHQMWRVDGTNLPVAPFLTGALAWDSVGSGPVFGNGAKWLGTASDAAVKLWLSGGINLVRRTSTSAIDAMTVSDAAVFYNHAGAVSATMPPTVDGRQILTGDASGAAGANPITYHPNAGETFSSTAGSLQATYVISVNGASVMMTFDASASTWRVR